VCLEQLCHFIRPINTNCMGCAANVLSFVESRCSGKRSCSGVLMLSASVLQEYCDDKSFVPTCSASDEVIIMEQATYGRMRLGKCVPEKYAESIVMTSRLYRHVVHQMRSSLWSRLLMVV
jgi:hypothetical protein